MADILCAKCRMPAPAGAHFCPDCGAPLVPTADAPAPGVAPRAPDPAGAEAPTLASGAGRLPVPSRPSPPASSSVDVPTFLAASAPESAPGEDRPERFPPGTMLAGRYRIVSQLGRGGMGEVYRATDLLLGQTVALKFLPAELARDEETLGRFRNEVRIARQISHPSVCRVYDLGEAGGLTYISMEFVDGEDLKSLLRRIGRLPPDKALEIGRQVCAGVAAAHDLGVVHRDLKPANIMLDGQGRARITDFGLAALESQVTDVGSGTPAYMAPEQRAGREVTARSDIYALGIVLHELYTGRRPADGSTTVEIEPAVQRVVEWCTAPEPGDRPPNARAVIAALPGGDPLAAALAAGETPSPEMVAAAGAHTGLSRSRAAALAAALVAGVALYAFIGNATVLFRAVPFDLTPDVLAQKAREQLDAFGIPRSWAEAWGFRVDARYLRWLRDRPRDAARAALARGRPAAVQFVYRASPNALLPYGPGPVEEGDPPVDRPGEIDVRLDTRGRLYRLLAQPSPGWPSSESTATTWARLFVAAGLDQARFEPATPAAVPAVTSDARAAWVGTPADGDLSVRIEAAQWRGVPVFFGIEGPWHDTGAAQTVRDSRRAAGLLGLILLPVAIGAWLAWRNWRRERIDPSAALRVGVFVQVTTFALACANLGLAQLASPRLGGWLVNTLGLSSYLGLAVVVLYLALEPEIRRLRPTWLITWTRLVGGNLRDALVGVHVLIGLALGAWTACAISFAAFWSARTGVPTHIGKAPGLEGLLSPLAPLGPALARTMLFSLVATFLIVMLRRVVRVAWVPEVLVITAFAFLDMVSGPQSPYRLAATIMVFALGFALFRDIGLLGLVAWLFTHDLLTSYPLTLDAAAWYPAGLWTAVVAVLGPTAVWAYRNAVSRVAPAPASAPRSGLSAFGGQG